jgi:hypothetical protein
MNKEKKWGAPQWVLLIVSVVIFLSVPVVAIFFDAKSAAASGQGFSVPFWPFVLILAVFLNPLIHDLIKAWMKMKVDIAKAENPPHEAKETEAEKPKEENKP